jgi:hypothetical protein
MKTRGLGSCGVAARGSSGRQPRHNINGGHIPSNSNYYRHSLDH